MPSAAAFIADQPELFAPAPTPVAIRPWDYVRMRRQAAGLTIEQVARRFWHREEHRGDVERNLRMFETPGVTVKDVRALNLDRAFLFDAATYRELADAPADRQPRLCRLCAWDRWTAQEDTQGYETTWSSADPSICTRCEQRGGEGAK